MTAMLHGLVADLADELRSALPANTSAANDDDNSDLVSELSASGLLDQPLLVELLLRRAEEEQIAGAMRARSGRREGRFLQSLVSDENPSISAAAMGLILARGRRRDRFGQMRIEFDDVPAEAAVAVANAVAAALRRRLAASADTIVADRQLSQSVAALLARHDEGRRLESLSGTIVRLLDEDGRLDEDLLASAAQEGEVALVAQALARRAGLRPEDAIDLLLSGEGRRLMLLMRMAAASREFVAQLLASLGDLLGSPGGRAIAHFDDISDAEADAAREWLRLPLEYRGAISALGQDHGHRAL